AAHNPLLQRTKRAIPPVPAQRREQVSFRDHQNEYRLRRRLGETLWLIFLAEAIKPGIKLCPPVSSVLKIFPFDTSHPDMPWQMPPKSPRSLQSKERCPPAQPSPR